jgi:hypothetical protein
MKNINYKDYLITFTQTSQGILATALHDNNDYFKIHYIDYPMTEIVKRIKKQCNYRLTNNIVEV